MKDTRKAGFSIKEIEVEGDGKSVRNESNGNTSKVIGSEVGKYMGEFQSTTGL